jgi:hypothetical protein
MNKLVVALAAIAIATAGVLQVPLVFATLPPGCTGDPHDFHSGPTGNPHDTSKDTSSGFEIGNPHDFGTGPKQEQDICPGS